MFHFKCAPQFISIFGLKIQNLKKMVISQKSIIVRMSLVIDVTVSMQVNVDCD